MFKYEIAVFGEVQGVGYRYFVVKVANKLGITGYVENVSDGSVKIIAEGEENSLKDFIESIKTEHPFAKVNDMNIKKVTIINNEFKDFKITF
ncbi:MAG: acylphosphatase [Elusimicrobia bacterium]|nr:acylphosphatase [Elusimicrobiota bacterium]